MRDIVGEFWEAWENYRAGDGFRPDLRELCSNLSEDGKKLAQLKELLEVEISGRRSVAYD